MEKLTALLPTGNEEQNVEDAIRNLAFADEILVVDSYSTDRTVELAQKHPVRIIQREYGYSASQKNWAIPQASHEWILLLDADERISPALRQEIQSVLENPQHDAYWIPRQNYLMGRKVRYSGWQGDRVIRLFRKSRCRYEDKRVHAEILVEGTTGQLRNKLEHYTYQGIEHFLEKSHRYATWGARDRAARTRKVTVYHLVIKPLWGFFHFYLVRLGVLDGKLGLVIALHHAYYLFERALKIWRIKEGEELQE